MSILLPGVQHLADSVYWMIKCFDSHCILDTVCGLFFFFYSIYYTVFIVGVELPEYANVWAIGTNMKKV